MGFIRESEIQDQLEDFIFELLSDASPLTSREDRKKLAKELKKRAYEHIEDQLIGMEKEHEETEKELSRMEKVTAEVHQENKACLETITKLEEHIEDLKLKISDPTRWAAKRYDL